MEAPIKKARLQYIKNISRPNLTDEEKDSIRYDYENELETPQDDFTCDEGMGYYDLRR